MLYVLYYNTNNIYKISQEPSQHYFLNFFFLILSLFSPALTKIIGDESLKQKPLQSQVTQSSVPPGRYLIIVNTTMPGF